MGAWGQNRSFGDVGSMSGLLASGHDLRSCDVANVPLATERSAAKSMLIRALIGEREQFVWNMARFCFSINSD
jgi:hypothetical protein